MGWYDPAWKYRIAVTIDHDQVDADLSDFDAEFTEANFPAAYFAAAKADGSDIVVTAQNGTTKLYRDLIHWSKSPDEQRVRVKTGVLAATDVYLWFYVGNAAASETENQTDAYHSSILNFWTLDESPGGAGSIIDRTGNNHATPTGVAQNAGGQLGPCLEWDGGTADEVDCQDIDVDGLTEVSILCWAYLDTRAGATYRVLMRKAVIDAHSSPYRVVGFAFDSPNEKLYFNIGDGTDDEDSGPSTSDFPLTTWTMVTGTWDGGDAYIYFNDTQEGTSGTTIAAIGTSSQSLDLGHGKNATGQYWDGRIDEVRVFDRYLTLNEISTRYNNESDPSSFYSVADMEMGLAGTIDGQTTVTATLTVPGPVPMAVTIDAQSTADATLGFLLDLAGAIDAQSTVAGALTIGVIHSLSGLVFARAGLEAYLDGGTFVAAGPVRLVAPNGKHEIRHVPFDWVRKAQPYTEALQVVSDEGHPNAVLWTDNQGWLEVSVDGGAYQPVGVTRAEAVSLGPLAAGVALDITLRLTVPITADVRTETAGLHLGGGI